MALNIKSSAIGYAEFLEKELAELKNGKHESILTKWEIDGRIAATQTALTLFKECWFCELFEEEVTDAA